VCNEDDENSDSSGDKVDEDCHAVVAMTMTTLVQSPGITVVPSNTVVDTLGL